MTAPDDSDVTATTVTAATSTPAGPARGALTDYLPMPPVERARRRWAWWLVLLLVVGGVAWATWSKRDAIAAWRSAKSDGSASMRFATAKRGDLRIVVTEEGKLRTVNSTRVYPQYRGANKITWLIAEGSNVKKDDLLATFDNVQYEDQLRQRKADLDTAMRTLSIAEEALVIQKKTAETQVAQAKSKMDEAQVAYRVYREMEAPKRLAEIDAAINEAKYKLATARKDLTDAQQRAESETTIQEEEKKAMDRELANLKDTVSAITKRLDAATLERKAFRAYTYPQSLAVKKQASENSKIEMEKAAVEARSQVLQKEAEVAKTKGQIAAINSQIGVLEKQIASLQVKAPIDGFVIYGDSSQPAYYYSGQRIAVGSEWYAGNVLMTIPDPSSFEAAVGIPETVRGWLKEGCAAQLVCDAVPGLVLQGKLKKIEKVARQGQFYEGGSNVFDGVVSIDKTDPRLITGMTARIEMLAETIPDALQVPIEAVANENGETVCYVRSRAIATATATAMPATAPVAVPAANSTGMSRRVVKIGRSSLHFVQVLEGLSEGDEVSLTPDREVAQKTEKPADKSNGSSGVGAAGGDAKK